MASLQTVATQYIDASNGVRFAYRKFGKAGGVPLVLNFFFRSNMDFWDPAFINAIGAARPVVLFDQAGVGRSSGTIATTYQGWADNQIAFADALGLKEYDVFGFSMGVPPPRW